MNFKRLTEHNLEFLALIGGCTGSSETIHVKMPHCWKSHVTAHLFIADYYLLPLDENSTGSDTAILGSIPIPAQNGNNEFQVSMIWDFHSSLIL